MSTPISFSRRTALGLAGIGLAAAAAPALVGCGSNSSGKSGPAALRFMFWGSDDRVQKFQEVCKAFNAAHADIAVTAEFGAIDAIRTKTTVGMTGKNLPDVLWVLGDLLPQMVADGHLLELDSYLGKEGGIAKDGMEESILTPGKINGKQYALVHGLQSVGVFAKKPVLDAVGVPVKIYPEAYTWEEYAQYCAAVHTAKGDKFFGTDDPNYAGAGNFFRAYARQHGQNLWNEKGDLGFTEDLLTEWLTYWKALRDSKAAVPTALALEQNPFFEGAPMIRNLAAFHMRNSNQMLELQGLSKEPLVLMPAPGNGGAGNSSIALDPNLLGIAGNTEHPEAAVTFVNYLLNDLDRAKIIGTTIGAPPTQAVRDAIASTVTDPEKLFLDHIGFEATAKINPVPPAPPTAGAFQSEMTKAIESLAYDKATIPDTVALIFGDLRSKLTAG